MKVRVVFFSLHIKLIHRSDIKHYQRYENCANSYYLLDYESFLKHCYTNQGYNQNSSNAEGRIRYNSRHGIQRQKQKLCRKEVGDTDKATVKDFIPADMLLLYKHQNYAQHKGYQKGVKQEL